MHKQQRLIGMLIVIALAVTLAIVNQWSGGAAPSSFQSSREPFPAVQATSEPTFPRQSASQRDGIPTVAFEELPRQAQRTIELIQRGGPFPYEKDGSIFRNRERLLPPQPDGYYREYTVETPGEADRGARRIVAGRNGELYYTDDHYESFHRVQ